MSHTFWNPRGAVEQGNPNTCAEVKLCLFFIFNPAQKIVCCETEDSIQLASTKFKLIRLKTSFRKQIETTVSN